MFFLLNCFGTYDLIFLLIVLVIFLIFSICYLFFLKISLNYYVYFFYKYIINVFSINYIVGLTQFYNFRYNFQGIGLFFQHFYYFWFSSVLMYFVFILLFIIIFEQSFLLAIFNLIPTNVFYIFDDVAFCSCGACGGLFFLEDCGNFESYVNSGSCGLNAIDELNKFFTFFLLYFIFDFYNIDTICDIFLIGDVYSFFESFGMSDIVDICYMFLICEVDAICDLFFICYDVDPDDIFELLLMSVADEMCDLFLTCDDVNSVGLYLNDPDSICTYLDSLEADNMCDLICDDVDSDDICELLSMFVADEMCDLTCDDVIYVHFDMDDPDSICYYLTLYVADEMCDVFLTYYVSFDMDDPIVIAYYFTLIEVDYLCDLFLTCDDGWGVNDLVEIYNYLEMLEADDMGDLSLICGVFIDESFIMNYSDELCELVFMFVVDEMCNLTCNEINYFLLELKDPDSICVYLDLFEADRMCDLYFAHLSEFIDYWYYRHPIYVYGSYSESDVLRILGKWCDFWEICYDIVNGSYGVIEEADEICRFDRVFNIFRVYLDDSRVDDLILVAYFVVDDFYAMIYGYGFECNIFDDWVVVFDAMEEFADLDEMDNIMLILSYNDLCNCCENACCSIDRSCIFLSDMFGDYVSWNVDSIYPGDCVCGFVDGIVVFRINNAFFIYMFCCLCKLFLVLCFFLFLFFFSFFLEKHCYITFDVFLLMLLSFFGILLIFSVSDFIYLYISLELQSLCFYILASFRRHAYSLLDSGLKYYIIGSFASVLFILGVACIYFETGLFDFSSLYLLIMYSCFNYIFIIFGLLCIFCSLLFKVMVVPFHVWSIDVYDGSHILITTFFSVFPKLGIFFILFLFCFDIFLEYSCYFSVMFSGCAIISIIYSTVACFVQYRIKRFLIFSSINHIGFCLLIFSFFSPFCIFSFFFYLFVYILTTLCLWCILIILTLSRFNGFIYLIDFSGLFLYNPYLAASFCVLMFTMMGLPPFIGFFSKLYMFITFMCVFDFFLIFIFCLLVFTVFSCYYYLRILKFFFFEKRKSMVFLKPITNAIALIISLLIFFFIFYFIFAQGILNILLYFIFSIV